MDGLSAQDAVLASMVNEPSYGYLIALQLDRPIAGVYRAIERLVALGLAEQVEVTRRSGRAQKWYRATENGRAAHRQIVARMLSERDDLLQSISDSATVEQIIAWIDEYEASILARLQSEPEDGSLLARLVWLHEHMMNNAALEWSAQTRELIASGITDV